MTDRDDFQAEIADCFLIEATDLIAEVESFLLTLERDPHDSPAFDALLRAMHNLKGSGKAVGFAEISKLGHLTESLLISARKLKAPLAGEIMAILLKTCDRFKNDFVILKENHKASLDHEDLYQALEHANNFLQEHAQGNFYSPPGNAFQDAEASGVDAYFAKKNPNPAATATAKHDDFVRISLRKIEDLLNNFGEQVILQATLDHIKFDLDRHHELALKTINQLNKLTYDLQQTTISLRMVNLKTLFSRMERTVRDTAVATGKKIKFISEGQDNELDKSIVDSIIDPLTHMVRNAVDHGLESPQERKKQGKDPAGTITLKGFRRSGSFYITVEDDGRGLDQEKILSKAKKIGLIPENAKLSEPEIYELIYANGFSTRDTATDISGRGVGMNVVKEAIAALKGVCQIESKLGSGTRFTIRLPLTLAIFSGIVTRIGANLYVIPQSDVERILAYNSKGIRFVSERGERVVSIENSVIPLVDLRDRLKTAQNQRAVSNADFPETTSRQRGTIIISGAGNMRNALIVDDVLTQQRIVHKSLGPEVNGLKGTSGVTILGDGSAALILDIRTLLNNPTAA